SKIESEYSKNLSNLARSFKEKEQIGVLEATLNKLRRELEVMATAHTKAADFFSMQADVVDKFKKDQSVNKRGVEDALSKAQTAKFAQLAKTKQLERLYVRKCHEKEICEASLRDIYTSTTAQAKEIEKARVKATKAEEEAEKADNAYKGAVHVLEDCRVSWEHEMTAACNAIQQLDEERIIFLRQELWKAINADSQIALDIDESCEQVREILEKCDVISDIDAFIQSRGTGPVHPEPFLYQHFSKMIPSAAGDNDSGGSDDTSYSSFNPYSTSSEQSMEDHDNISTGRTKKHFPFSRGILTRKN
ncbi:proline-serine-threonine phosphatase-interacting protein 2, partial [Plakobranchus ocellatus]